MKGIFDLNSHTDLFKKLEWEFDRLIADPSNAYLAYNFFVTAWHLLEWKYPDPGGKAQRDKIRDQTPLLQICEHLAVGAKHFNPTSKRHQSVSNAKRSDAWGGAWGEAWGSSWSNWLVVELSGDAQKTYGDKIKVDALADHVMNYWRAAFETEASST